MKNSEAVEIWSTNIASKGNLLSNGVPSGSPDTDKESVLEGASSGAFSMFQHEPWYGGDEVELVCGLSQGRTF